MAKVKFLASIYGLGSKGETKEIPGSEVDRLGEDIEVLEAPKKYLVQRLIVLEKILKFWKHQRKKRLKTEKYQKNL